MRLIFVSDMAVCYRKDAAAVRLEPLWTLAVLESTDNSGAEVSRTSFHNGYARAFMIKGRDAVFDSCMFENAGGLHIGPEVGWHRHRHWPSSFAHYGPSVSSSLALLPEIPRSLSVQANFRNCTLILPLFHLTTALLNGLQVNWLEGDPGIANVTVSNNIIRNLGIPAISVDPSVPASAIVLKNNTQATRASVAGSSGSELAIDNHDLPTPRVEVDWAAFLARSDPVNRFDVRYKQTIPDVWLEGAFAGNGLIGAQLLVCPGGICRQSLLLGLNTTFPFPDAPYRVAIPLTRSDVTDIRTGKLAETCDPVTKVCGVNRGATGRLGAGVLMLRPTAGRILRGEIRTSLATGTINATIITTKGTLSLSVYVHAERQLVVVDGTGSRGEPAELGWEFFAAPAIPVSSGIKGAEPFSPLPPGYKLNPPVDCGPTSCTQALLASKDGRGWTTAWRRDTTTAGSSGRLFVALTSDLPRATNSPPKTVRAVIEAQGVLNAAVKLGAAALIANHTAWWSRYYFTAGETGSFMTLPASAARVEQFHWIQVRSHGPDCRANCAL